MFFFEKLLKMSTREETSEAERKFIVKLRKQGNTFSKIAIAVNRPVSTIKKIYKKFNDTGNVKNLPRSGRPTKLSEATKRSIVRTVKKNPCLSAVKIAETLSINNNETVSASSVRRALYSGGLHGRVPRKKPFISKVNKKRRLDFANNHKKQDTSYWKNMIFSDESKFELFGHRKQPKIWRSVNKEFSQQNIQPTIKHGGGSVMVWGCMAASGVGSLVFVESTMKKEDYHRILQDNLLASADKLRMEPGWTFQQDNDPKHKSKLVMEWLLYRVPKLLDHPPQSPDVNPIEHLWDHLDNQIRKHEVTSISRLKEIILEEWHKIPPSVTSKLVESMPNRLKAIIKAKGGPTKY